MPREWTEEQRQKARETRLANLAAKKAQAAVAPEDRGATEPTTTDASVAPSETSEVQSDTPAPPLLDDYKRERIRQEAAKVIEEALAKQREKEEEKAYKEAFEEEVLRQKRLAGLIDHQDDIIEFRINVAPHARGVTINGEFMPHGSWQKKTRRVYDSIRDIMARSWESEYRAGNPCEKMDQRYGVERVNAGMIYDPSGKELRMPDGTFTLNFAHTLNAATGIASPSARRALG